MDIHKLDKSSLLPGEPKPIFTALDQAFIRMPTLPVETLMSMDKTKAAEESSLFHEALLIASTSLIDSLSRSKGTLSTRKVRQMESSLLRYVNRMSSRTTPFGLFSGIAQIPIGRHTRITLGSAADHRHRTRLDMDWLSAYINLLEDDSRIKPHLFYTYQPIVTRVGNRYNFEYRNPEGVVTNGSVIATSGVELLIEKTRDGKKYETLFSEMLAEIPESNAVQLTSFISKFINYGIILSSLRPPLTHDCPARYVLEQLEAIPEAHESAQRLRILLEKMRHYDTLAPGSAEKLLRQLSAEAKQTVSMPHEHVPFDIDLALQFPEPPTLQKSLADDAVRLAEILLKLSQRDPEETPLSSYRQAFLERYGHHRLLPVLEVLSPDVGLGLPSGYHNRASARNKKRFPMDDGDYSDILLKLAIESLREKRLIVDLDAQAITRLTNPKMTGARLPQSIDIAVQIAAASQHALNQDDYLLIASPLTGAQAAGRSIGRFADMLGDRTTQYLQTIVHLQEARQEDRLHAELVYMPHSGHAANVSIRPSLRDYEIVLNAASGVDRKKVLALDDLYVGVHEKRFYIWSATHQKEVSLHIGHMLNTLNAPSICRFLADVSEDGKYAMAKFSWGSAARLPVLPRLTHGRLVLSLAEWKMDAKDILDSSTFLKKQLTEDEISQWYRKVQQWRKKWLVPRFVYLAEKDNRLLLDLEQKEHVMELFHAATTHGKHQTLCLQEALPGPEHAWIVGSDGHYINECVFQLVQSPECEVGKSSTVSSGYQTSSRQQRAYMPGSEWLYCKLYLPASQQNEFIAAPIESLTRAIEERHAADAWFFMRYADPEPHIRIRFKASKDTILRLLFPIITAWTESMQTAGLLQRFCIDSYERETERYGGEAAIEIAEKIFGVESEMDLQLIRLEQTGQLHNLALSDVAVLTTSMLLESFGLDDAQRIAWSKMRHTFHKQFAQDYRQDRQKILSLMQQYRAHKPATEHIRDVCAKAESRLLPLVDQYHQLEVNGQLTIPMEEILPSFIHMHNNRLLGIDRIQEQRILTYLSRTLADLPKWEQREKSGPRQEKINSTLRFSS